MRTTLDIAPDVLLAAKDLAARNRSTMGEVISDLARKSLAYGKEVPQSGLRNGFPLLPATGQSITSELIKSLLDDEV
jgi:hypothetical protein